MAAWAALRLIKQCVSKGTRLKPIKLHSQKSILYPLLLPHLRCRPKFTLVQKKGRLLTGATIALLIGGGAYASTVDLFSSTKLVNPFFALLDPEAAHKLVVGAAALGWVPREKRPDPSILSTELWGKRFSNPIGLSAGFDKNAEVVEGLLGICSGKVADRPTKLRARWRSSFPIF